MNSKYSQINVGAIYALILFEMGTCVDCFRVITLFIENAQISGLKNMAW